MKSKLKKVSKVTLSDKIADALTVKPAADIEDDQVFGTKPKTLTRAELSSSESEDEAAISDFRKRSVNLLSEISKKYAGQVVSKKDLKRDEEETSNLSEGGNSDEEISLKKSLKRENGDKEDSSADSDSDSEDDAESDDYSIVKKQIDASDDDDDDDDDEEQGDEDEEGDEDGYDISQMDEPIKENFNHVKKQNISEEAKKGACVRNQLLLWEGLLEMRIHLQRCLATANQMPLPETHEQLRNVEEFAEQTNITKANIASVLEKFLQLQNMLLKGFPETKTMSDMTKKIDDKKTEQKTSAVDDDDEEIPSDTDEEIPSDTEDEEKAEEPSTNVKTPTKKRKLEDYEKEISKKHKSFKQFRDSTIQKWNEKTRLATANNIKNHPTNTILQQISYILSDRNKLIKRTQLKRSDFHIIGYEKPTSDINTADNDTEINPVTKDRKDNDEYITEIFDDSDFYHQLLRELIECKSADISDPIQLSRQWIALQQMRSKMKRKVDTKATKGRRIKYVVHNQLVNFMAPEKCTSWTEESANELYNSLFGKLFESNNVGMNGNVENGFKLRN